MPPGSTICVVAPTYAMLMDATLASFMELYEPFIAHHHKQLLTTMLVNGSKILWRSADRPNRLRGFNASAIWIDEAAYISEEAFKVLLGRLRKAPGRMWLTTTPRGFDWIYKLFTSGNPDYHLIRASTRTNTFLPQDFVGTLQENYSSALQAQEIEGDFVDLENARIQRSWFRYSEAPSGLPVSLGVDLAISTRQSADYTAVVASVFDPDSGNRWVLDAQRDRKSFNGAKNFIEQMAAKWQAQVVNVESVAYQAAMVQELTRTTSLNVKAVVSSKDKLTRFAPVEARLEQGLVHFVPGLPGYLEDELLSFPSGPHDDLCDALAMSLNIPARRRIRLL